LLLLLPLPSAVKPLPIAVHAVCHDTAATISDARGSNGNAYDFRVYKRIIKTICTRFALFGYCLWNKRAGGGKKRGVFARAHRAGPMTAPAISAADDFGNDRVGRRSTIVARGGSALVCVCVCVCVCRHAQKRQYLQGEVDPRWFGCSC